MKVLRRGEDHLENNKKYSVGAATVMGRIISGIVLILSCIAMPKAFASESKLHSEKTSTSWDLGLDASLHLKGRSVQIQALGTHEWSYYGFSPEFGLALNKPILDSWKVVLEADIFSTKFTHRKSRLSGYAFASGLQYLLGKTTLESLLYYQNEDILMHSYGIRLGSFYNFISTWSAGLAASAGRYPVKSTEAEVSAYAVAFVIKTKLF